MENANNNNNNSRSNNDMVQLDNVSIAAYHRDTWLDVELDDFIVEQDEDDDTVIGKARSWFLLHGGNMLCEDPDVGIYVFRESVYQCGETCRTIFRGSAL